MEEIIEEAIEVKKDQWVLRQLLWDFLSEILSLEIRGDIEKVLKVLEEFNDYNTIHKFLLSLPTEQPLHWLPYFHYIASKSYPALDDRVKYLLEWVRNLISELQAFIK